MKSCGLKGRRKPRLLGSSDVEVALNYMIGDGYLAQTTRVAGEGLARTQAATCTESLLRRHPDQLDLEFRRVDFAKTPY